MAILQKNIFLFLIFGMVMMVACSSDNQPDLDTQSIKPNLFLFLADDLSAQDLGVTGNQYVKTAAIDSFASLAISFEKMYTPSAMCAPSRSALMTGLYPHRNGCHMNHGAIYENVKSLPTYLMEVGYQVALVGKKHIKPAKNFPYDYIDYSNLETYLSKVDKPLCLIYASNEPHSPHLKSDQPLNETILPTKWVDTKSTREKIVGYYADIAALDKEFEAFLAAIKKNKLDKKSITIFTSDHGYEYFGKWSCYERGLRIPFYLQKKGLSFKVKTVNQLTSFVDVVPTFVDLAGGKIPNDLDGKSLLPLLKGQDKPLRQFIYGAHTTRGIYSGKAYPIRSITDGKWKYIRNLNHTEKFQNILTNGWDFDPPPRTGSWAEWLAVLKNNEKDAEWVTFYQNRPIEELYDLDNDPNEMNNLAADPIYQKMKNQLSQQLSTWMEQQGDTGMKAELSVPLKARDRSKIPK